MKQFLLAIILIHAATSCKLNLGAQVNLVDNVLINCQGAQNHVTYGVQNLPSGVRLHNNRLEVFDNSRVTSGQYPVRIRAFENGQVLDEQVVVIVLGPQTGNFGRGIRTISVSQQSTGSASTTTSSSASAAAVEFAQPDAGVGSLLDSLQVPTSGYTSTTDSSAPVDPNASYPALKFPTAGNPDLPNFTPNLIATSRAPRTAANRNKITADDVRTQVIFDRQFNAAKALANLLSIVKQATANRNVAQEEVKNREGLLAQATNKQRTAQAVVTKAQGDVARIKQGINVVVELLNNLKKKIDDLVARQRELNGLRDSANQGLNTANNQYNDVNNQIQTAERDLKDTTDLKYTRQTECDNYDSAVKNAENEKFAKSIDADDVARRLTDAKAKVDADTQRVNDLAAQLEAARNNLANSQKYAHDLANQQAALKNALDELTRRIDDLRNRKTACANDVNSLNAKIDGLKNTIASLNDRRQKIADEITSIKAQVATYTAELDQIPAQLKALEDQQTTANKNLAFLRNQLPIFERLLNDAYVAGNSANDAVRVAKQNHEAAVKRYNDEDNIAQTATRNLELARVEKEQADAAVQALVRDGANVLPFAAAPTESYQPDTAGTVQINTWSDFVNARFGLNVRGPSFVGDLNTLYSFRLPGQEGSAANTEVCAANGQTSVSGYVAEVNGNSFKVLPDGGTPVRVSYAGCTVAVANRPNHSLSVGDVVVLRGLPTQSQDLKATYIACVSQ